MVKMGVSCIMETLMSTQLILGDCLEEMKKIPDGSIDLVLTDPPYGTTACKWDTVIPFEPMWEQLKRVTKKNGAIVLFGSQPFTSALVMSNPKMFKYEWVWHKNFSGGFATAKFQPMKYHENIVVFSIAKTAYNPIFEDYAESVKKRFKEGESVNVNKQSQNSTNQIHNGFGSSPHSISFKRGRYPSSVQKIDGVPNCNGVRVHPTQKPVALMEYLIKTYTNEGETVLDFTMGSGTTGVACKNLNRNFIGIELDPTYFEIAKARIEAA
jgi:site-specific DNA-methyltransferase (adenine-specific)